jgi:putative transposase
MEFPGALYHVALRGDGWGDIYRSGTDRQAFFAVFGGMCERFNWWVHAYCLMTNRYRRLVETPDGNLSKRMRQLNGVSTLEGTGASFWLHCAQVSRIARRVRDAKCKT